MSHHEAAASDDDGEELSPTLWELVRRHVNLAA